MKNILLLILCVQIITSCKPKSGETVVTGTLLNENGKPLINHTFELRKRESTISMMTLYQLENTYSTDEKGSFQFSFDASSNFFYKLFFKESACFSSKELEIQNNQTNQFIVKLISKRFVNLYMHEKYIGDSVSIKYNYVNELNTLDFTIDKTILIYKLNLPTNYISPPSNTDFNIVWSIFSKNILMSKDSIVAPTKSCDTLKISIQ